MLKPIIQQCHDGVTNQELFEAIEEFVMPRLMYNNTLKLVIKTLMNRLAAATKFDCTSEDLFLENMNWAVISYHARQAGDRVPCRGCEKTFDLPDLYHCYRCESYLCNDCAPDHFGPMAERLLAAAKKANQETEAL